MNDFSFSMLLFFVAVGILIFIGFNIYRRWVLPNTSIRQDQDQHRMTFIRLEIISWSLFFVSVIYYSLSTALTIAVFLITLVVLIFFDFWRNYFSGIIYKFEGKLQPGDTISVNGHSGRVLEFGTRALKMMDGDGDEVLISYHSINSEVKIEQKLAAELLCKTFIIEVELGEHSEAKPKLEMALFTNPWIILSKPVRIAWDDRGTILNFYVLNNEFFERAKRQLLKDLAA